MKKNLLIKIDDGLLDVESSRIKAMQKACEFFIGSYIPDKEFMEYVKNSEGSHCQIVSQFLKERERYILDPSIEKKFGEYFWGKDFKGYIRESALRLDDAHVEEIIKKYNVMLFSSISKEEGEFLSWCAGLDGCKVVAGSAQDSLKKAKRSFKTKFHFVGTSEEEKKAAEESDVSYLNMQGLSSKKIMNALAKL